MADITQLRDLTEKLLFIANSKTVFAGSVGIIQPMAQALADWQSAYDAQAAELAALRQGISDCHQMLLAEPNTRAALDRAEDVLRWLLVGNAGAERPAANTEGNTK